MKSRMLVTASATTFVLTLLMSSLAWSQVTPSNVVATEVTSTTAVITWTTNIKADELVEYGTTPSLELPPAKRAIPSGGSHPAAWNFYNSKFHFVPLIGLSPNTTYYFRVTSKDTENGPGNSLDGIPFQTSPSPGSYNYGLESRGPHHVHQGSALYIGLNIWLLTPSDCSSGCPVYFDPQPSGPPNTTFSYTTFEEGTCCGTYFWKPEDSYPSEPTFILKLQTQPSTPLGVHPVTIETLSNGVRKKTIFTVFVDPPPQPVSPGSLSFPPIPDKDIWEQKMTQYGRHWCGTAVGDDQQTTWYYDGQRVYFQIRDYTNDPFWDGCANQVEQANKSYIRGQNYSIGGFKVFTEGLYQDRIRNFDTDSENDVLRLAQDSHYAGIKGGSPDGKLLRETAYIIETWLHKEALTGSPVTRLPRSVDYALGHIDQMVVSRTAEFVQPFMLGLNAEALIRYHEKYQDPRIPWAVKDAMDWIWENTRVPNCSGGYVCFLFADRFYDCCGGGDRDPATDLNNLISPAFAWLYKTFGDETYQIRGDQIFAAGARIGAVDFRGKQYAEGYRWSFDYVRWRQTPPPGGPDGDPPHPPSNLQAEASSASQVTLTWNIPFDNVGVTGYEVYRSSNNGPFTSIATPSTNSFTDSGLSSGVTYLYKVRARDAVPNWSGFSTTDLATTILFTDDPLTIGTTMIKAIHITELRQAVNAVRASAGLGAVSWTDPTLTAGITPIKAIHMQEMRSNLNQARSISGLSGLSYTDPTLTVGTTVVKKVHIDELRQGVK